MDLVPQVAALFSTSGGLILDLFPDQALFFTPPLPHNEDQQGQVDGESEPIR
jgi:hypothetical protein